MESLKGIVFLLVIIHLACSFNEFKFKKNVQSMIDKNQETSLSHYQNKCELFITKLSTKQKIFLHSLEEENPNLFLQFCLKIQLDEITWNYLKNKKYRDQNQDTLEATQMPFRWGKRVKNIK
jgi:hypothetical protein